MGLAVRTVLALALYLGIPGVQGAAKYQPGDTMRAVDYETVDSALDDVLKAGGVGKGGRRCAIGVANLGLSDENSLSVPLDSTSVYIGSGYVPTAPPTTIRNRQTGLVLFMKRDAVGPAMTNGLLSYHIGGTNHKIVILWEVPRSLATGVRFNVKIYRKDVPIDRDLYNHIHKYGDTLKSTTWLEKEEYGIKLTATMSQSTQSKLYISVDPANYDVNGSPVLNTACDSHPVYIGKYCWQECTPIGFCWVDQKCKSDTDCKGPLKCFSKCMRS